MDNIIKKVTKKINLYFDLRFYDNYTTFFQPVIRGSMVCFSSLMCWE